VSLREVDVVLNDVSELSLKGLERERRILSSYCFNRFTQGAGGRD
jgi:hypothetical protein